MNRLVGVKPPAVIKNLSLHSGSCFRIFKAFSWFNKIISLLFLLLGF